MKRLTVYFSFLIAISVAGCVVTEKQYKADKKNLSADIQANHILIENLHKRLIFLKLSEYARNYQYTNAEKENIKIAGEFVDSMDNCSGSLRNVDFPLRIYGSLILKKDDFLKFQSDQCHLLKGHRETIAMPWKTFRDSRIFGNSTRENSFYRNKKISNHRYDRIVTVVSLTDSPIVIWEKDLKFDFIVVQNGFVTEILN